MAKYTFGASLGEGGFGEVCEVACDDGWTGVAKRLKDAGNPENLERFRREVRLQTQLSHPGIVRIRAMNLTSGRPWFAMDRADSNLREYLVAGNHGEELLPLFVSVARAVEYAHANGIIHRDLKPENVLLFDDPFEDYPDPMVSDFGLGRHIDITTLTLTQTDVGVGTVAYAAPEQISDGHSVDARADVYSLGKILYEVLTGRLPYPVLDLNAVSAKYRFLIQKATDVSPDRRYSSVTALLTDLDTLTNRTQDLERPEQTVLGICEKYSGSVSRQVEQSDFDLLFKTLLENLGDYTLVVRAVPKLVGPLLTKACNELPDQLVSIVEAYDSAISRDITFEYCDVVADFYEELFDFCTAEPRIQAIVVRRLATLGSTYNRWHVGRTFARLLKRITNPALLLEIQDELRQDPGAAAWLSDYVSDVPPLLRSLFQ